MQAAGYTLQLYCDHTLAPKYAKMFRREKCAAPGEYSAETYGQCARMALADKWRLGKDRGRNGPDLCPAHARGALVGMPSTCRVDDAGEGVQRG